MKQVLRHMHLDFVAKVEAGVGKLLNACFKREDIITIWLANVVPIRKKK